MSQATARELKRDQRTAGHQLKRRRGASETMNCHQAVERRRLLFLAVDRRAPVLASAAMSGEVR